MHKEPFRVRFPLSRHLPRGSMSWIQKMLLPPFAAIGPLAATLDEQMKWTLFGDYRLHCSEDFGDRCAFGGEEDGAVVWSTQWLR